jgi:hypothetical protein
MSGGVQHAPTATGEMMYLPGGVQTITPVEGGLGAWRKWSCCLFRFAFVFEQPYNGSYDHGAP